MRKLLLMLAMLPMAVAAGDKPKEYTLKLNEQQLQVLGYVIQNTTAPHNLTVELQQLLQNQLINQVDSTATK